MEQLEQKVFSLLTKMYNEETARSMIDLFGAEEIARRIHKAHD